MTRTLVTGSTGQVGQEVLAVAAGRGHRVEGLARGAAEPCDLRDRDAVLARVSAFRPDLIVHAGAFTAVDRCEAEPDLARAVNVAGTAHVAEAARAVGAHVVYLSTDYVYDGTKDGPYVETDPVNPLSVYGRTKLDGEGRLDGGWTVARTSWVCGAHGPNMVRTILRLAAGDGTLRFVDDQVGHPTFTADLAPRLLDLGQGRAAGVFHVTNAGAVSWHRFAREVLAAAGHDPDRVEPVATADLVPPRPAPRPANSVLENRALAAAGYPPLPDFRAALRALVATVAAEGAAR